MERLSKWQFASEWLTVGNNIYTQVEPKGGIAYVFAAAAVDLVLSGLIDIIHLTKHMIWTFCFVTHDALTLGILPPLPPLVEEDDDDDDNDKKKKQPRKTYGTMSQ